MSDRNLDERLSEGFQMLSDDPKNDEEQDLEEWEKRQLEGYWDT